MSVELGSYSTGSTGNTTVLLNGSFTPSVVWFWIGARSGTNETDIRLAVGSADFANGNDTAMSTFNGTNKGTRPSTTKCVRHYIDSAGATLKLEGNQVSSASGQFVINMTTVDSNYPIYFIAFS